MSRIIKFRAWDGREMRGQSNLMIDMSGRQYWQFGYDAPKPIELDREPFVLMQFTGLCDRNGREIYEGDLVRILYTEPVEGVVSFFADGHTCAPYYTLVRNGDERDTYHFSSEDNREVIGNIYEQPELVEGTK